MLFKFPKYFISPLLLFLILFLGAKLADSSKLFAELSLRLKNEMGQTPFTPLEYNDNQSPLLLVATKEEFNLFIVKKTEILAEVLKQIQKETNEKEFDNVINKYETLIRKADGGKYIKILEGFLDEKEHRLLLFIIQEYPPSFFVSFLDEFLWKSDGNLHLIMENNKDNSIGKKTLLIEQEYIKLRKRINEYLKELKITMIYGQGIKAINEIEKNHAVFQTQFKMEFDELDNEAKKLVHENMEEIITVRKKVKSVKKRKEKLKEIFMNIAKKQDISREYNELYLYNLLNNAIIELYKNLQELVDNAINEMELQKEKSRATRKEIQIGTGALAEYVVEPLLRQSLNDALAVMPSSSDTTNFGMAFRGENNNMANYRIDNILLNPIKNELGLSSKFFKLESLFVYTAIHKANFGAKGDNATNSGEKEKAVRKSHIRFSAAKLLLAYERLKSMYYGKQEFKDSDNLENVKILAEQLSETLAGPMTSKNYIELIEKYFSEKNVA